jgi:GPH family glycoside/pentoside/hexuronide:cation symporter
MATPEQRDTAAPETQSTPRAFASATPDSHTTAPEDRVPWPQLIAYGMGGLIPIALFNIAGQLMGLLGNISLGLSAFLLGTIMIIPRLWDALSDPIIGHLTDNTRTRWGRRRPYILLGGIAVAVSFVAIWWMPRGEWIREIFPSDAAYNWFQLTYILVGLLLFFTACNVFEIPHGALGMEMSDDYHERTRLFSAKSFLGNLCAMGTPWLILLADLQFFRGESGNLIDGMRYVSMLIAAVLILMTIWWFVSLKEPRFSAASERRKSDFWADMRTTATNRTFLCLTAAIFTLAMGFNFVGNFANYITIFYLYDGNITAASPLLGINGTIWAVTGLVAVFPLNWLGRRLGKRNTLLIAILLMCIAQLTKIVCYDPAHPYLVIIPTILLSAGMLMFFTLGPSMVGDVCDEDELHTGTRSEGSYFSVFWWFIKMGTAFASFVTGALLVFTHFDETQGVTVDAMQGNVKVIRAEALAWLVHPPSKANADKFQNELARLKANAEKLKSHLLSDSSTRYDDMHAEQLKERLRSLEVSIAILQSARENPAADPLTTVRQADDVSEQLLPLRRQPPITLFRLRFVEIGIPLALSIVSIWLTLRYPLTEARCYEIKELLKQRRAEAAT